MTEPLPKVPVETIIEKIDKPKSSGIAIKIIISLLILVILSEIGYLLYNNYFKTGSPSLSGPTIEEVTNNLPNTPESTTKNTPTPPTNIVNNEINQESIQRYTNFFEVPEIKYKNASFAYTLEGKVDKVRSTSIQIDGIDYPHGIVLKQEAGNSIGFSFTAKELITTKVTDPYNSQTKLNLTDLKVGDEISLSISTDLINNPNSESKFFINILK